MPLKLITSLLLLFPMMVQAQDSQETKSIKIEFLQALNKLESGINKSPAQLLEQKDHILAMMDREVTKNNLLTEKLMKNPDRSKAQRDQIQDQLSLTAKQKYISKAFSRLDWEGEKLSPKTTLDLVRNFMNIIQ